MSSIVEGTNFDGRPIGRESYTPPPTGGVVEMASIPQAPTAQPKESLQSRTDELLARKMQAQEDEEAKLAVELRRAAARKKEDDRARENRTMWNRRR